MVFQKMLCFLRIWNLKNFFELTNQFYFQILLSATHSWETWTFKMVHNWRTRFEVFHQRLGTNKEVLQSLRITCSNAIHTFHGNHASSATRCATYERRTYTQCNGRKTNGTRKWWYSSCEFLCFLDIISIDLYIFIILAIRNLWWSKSEMSYMQ